MDHEQPKLDRGRPPKGPELADKVHASDQARLRLKVILQTISGELTIPQACQQLNLSEARFHELRSEWLQSAAQALEPKPLGRPTQTTPQEQAEIKRLRERAENLELHLQAARVREQIALTMPHLLVDKSDKDADTDRDTIGRSAYKKKYR